MVNPNDFKKSTKDYLKVFKVWGFGALLFGIGGALLGVYVLLFLELPHGEYKLNVSLFLFSIGFAISGIFLLKAYHLLKKALEIMNRYE